MRLREVEQEVIREFAMFENWEERYEHLITLGKALPRIAEIDRTENKLIKGCQSQVWLNAHMEKNRIFLQADSDAILPRGIAALMARVYSGCLPHEITSSEAIFISEIGLKEFLSPTRSNGMVAMLKQIKFYAMVFEMKASV
ncbi:MAG: SufE family protein [Flavobacteriales bacterium AspAUS03]